MSTNFDETTQSDTADDKEIVQLQARIRQQIEPSNTQRFAIPLPSSNKQSKSEKKEGNRDYLQVKSIQVYAVFLVLLLKFSMLSMYLMYQSRAITILVHELQRIGDGTDYILDKMNYL